MVGAKLHIHSDEEILPENPSPHSPPPPPAGYAPPPRSPGKGGEAVGGRRLQPGFEVDEKVIGFIKDYRRVFDFACIDHRGTPERPARTCTLEENDGALCWGAAYCVRGGPEKEKAAMEYLERRECEYDHKTLVDFYKEGENEQPHVTGVIV